LQDPARLRELSSPEGLPDELTGIVAQIQATNQRLRELENNYQAVDSSLLVLQVRLDLHAGLLQLELQAAAAQQQWNVADVATAYMEGCGSNIWLAGNRRSLF
jgi:hypothetical protein